MAEPVTIWLLGPTASGKTTLGERITARFRHQGEPVMHFDGDEVRNFFPRDMGFSAQDRLRVVDTICQLANKCADAGISAVVSALTANEDARGLVLSQVQNLFIVYLDCPIGICIERDPKGLYKKAIAGEIDTLAGFNTPYLAPKEYDFALDTSRVRVEEAVNLILRALRMGPRRNRIAIKRQMQEGG